MVAAVSKDSQTSLSPVTSSSEGLPSQKRYIIFTVCPASTLGPPPETCSTSGFSSKTKKCTQHFHTHDCKVCKIMLKTKSWTLIYLPDGLASTKLYWLYLLPRITSLRTPWESAVPNHLVVPVWHVAKLCTDLILNKRSEIRQDTGTVEDSALVCFRLLLSSHFFVNTNSSWS